MVKSGQGVKFMPQKTSQSGKKLTLIISDEKNPKIALKAGMKLDVVSVKLADPQLKRPKVGAARLCSGGGTCIALIEVG